MTALTLIVRRLRIVLLDRLLFRLRYLVGFLVFVVILWLLTVIVAWFIDTEYWDRLKSDQFISFEGREQPNRISESDSAK